MGRYGADFYVKSNDFARSRLCKVPEPWSDNSDRYWRSLLCKFSDVLSSNCRRYLSKITDVKLNR